MVIIDIRTMDVRTVIAFYAVAVCADELVIYHFRELLLSFLMSKHNRKKAQRIHKEQPIRDRITMAYIGPMLQKNTQQYYFYQRLYIADLVTLIPQYLLILLFHFLLGNGVWIPLCVVSAIKGLLFLFLRFQFNAHHISRYDKRYRRNK